MIHAGGTRLLISQPMVLTKQSEHSCRFILCQLEFIRLEGYLSERFPTSSFEKVRTKYWWTSNVKSRNLILILIFFDLVRVETSILARTPPFLANSKSTQPRMGGRKTPVMLSDIVRHCPTFSENFPTNIGGPLLKSM